MAPTHMEVPSGSFIRLLYEASAEGIVPVLAVKLQEMFGMQESPAIAEGKVPVLVHLLSPREGPCRSPAISKDFGRMGIQPSERKCGGGIRSTRGLKILLRPSHTADESASSEQVEGKSFGLSRRGLLFEKAPSFFVPGKPCGQSPRQLTLLLRVLR